MLTPSHYELLSFIDAHIEANGFSPSFTEMARAVNLRSKSGVHRLLGCLEERGYVRRLPGKARAIEVVRQPGEAPRTSPEAAFIEAARAYLHPDQFAAIAALAHGSAGIAADLAEIVEARS